MNHNFLVFLVTSIFCVIAPLKSIASAEEINSSVWKGVGEGVHGDNGALIIGVTPSKKISGYYESNYTAGNEVIECKFYFAGNLASIQITSANPNFINDTLETVKGSIQLRMNNNHPVMQITLQKSPPSCGWMFDGLPNYKPPSNFTLKQGLNFSFIREGNWSGVGIVQTTRTFFHARPDFKTKKKAFIVRGDLIYIYDEKPEWYFVKYQSQKAETTGWIKKSDAVQFIK